MDLGCICSAYNVLSYIIHYQIPGSGCTSSMCKDRENCNYRVEVTLILNIDNLCGKFGTLILLFDVEVKDLKKLSKGQQTD